MLPRPDRIERLPEQYFTTLLARVTAAGPDVIDVGRGNPDVPPPAHVVEALVESAREPTAAVHGYPPFAGLKAAKHAIAQRYATVYGVELDPDREVAFLPGTTTHSSSSARARAARRADSAADPGYPDYNSAVALAGAERVPSHSMRTAALTGRARRGTGRRGLPQLSGQPGRRGRSARRLRRGDRVRARDRRGDRARLRLRRPRLRRPPAGELLAEDGAREVGVEMFSLSKSYGMAGWGSASWSATPRSSRG